jgi:hypothetical protein
MTARKINCSTKCSQDGTPRATLRELLNGWKRRFVKETGQNQYSTRGVQYRRSSTGQNQYSTRGVQYSTGQNQYSTRGVEYRRSSTGQNVYRTRDD